MAISTSTVWDVRPATGSDTNGGGFVTGASGTDWSQQASPQYSVTDGVAVGTTTVTSATAAFGTDVVGNIANIGGAWFQIISRTNATTIVVDRNVTTGSGLTIKIGGAFATISQANSVATANNQIYFQGTYTVTTALTVTLQSDTAPGTPLSFIGYTSTHGDGGQATWTTSTNSIDLVDFTQARGVLFQNIIFSSTAGTPGDGIQAKTTGNTLNVTLINCKLSGFSVGIEGNFNVNWAFVGLFMIKCRVTGCTSHGLRNSGGTYIFGCVFDNNTGDGAQWSGGTIANSSSWSIGNSVFYKNANGINVNGLVAPASLGEGLLAASNSAFSTNTSAGLLYGNNAQLNTKLHNCIFDANGTYGIDGSSGSTTVSALGFNNAFFNNTTAATRNVNAGIGTITLSASPYTAPSSMDFSLNSTAGGGAALKAAGFPGVTPFGTGSADVGPLQSSGGGGSTTYVVNHNVTQYFQNEEGDF